MNEISLNGAWQFCQRGGEQMQAVVPGCNYHDFLRLGKIEDPFYGENERHDFWIAQMDFDYTRTFTLTPEDLQADKIELACEMLDTLCRVYLNGQLVGTGQNSHIGYAFDVTRALRAGENNIKIEFDSPVRAAEQLAKQFKAPPVPPTFPGRTHLRKAQCHFGWDWGPVLPVSGITGNIALKCYSAAKLAPMRIAQQHQNGQVVVKAHASAERYQPGARLRFSLRSPQGDLLEQLESDENSLELTALIEQPQLWWVHELSSNAEQPLYTLKCEAIYEDKLVDVMECRIGLRTIALNRQTDEYGQNFRFLLNGVPLFAKGANYIPPDSFPDRATLAVKRGLLEQCVKANMNMVRIWGGGFYETDDFYDICDRMGLLVWQDFAFACAPYPFDRPDFLQNVHDEVDYNVTRLRHHASLALWCGNNELEIMAMLWKPWRGLSHWTERFFWHVLPAWVQENDGQTPFIPGSPIGHAPFKGAADDREGDTHLWAVWHGMQPIQYYRKRHPRFCSEFGMESLPSMEAVRSFAPPEQRYLASPVMQNHQKCPAGNNKILYYMASNYQIPKGFADLLYLSQLVQAEVVRDATEHWRRNRGRCNGSVYWQLNDCWPVNSWASIDSLGCGKALQFAARRFNAPVSVSMEDNNDCIRLFVFNDTREARRLTLTWQLTDFYGNVLRSGTIPVNSPALTSHGAHALDPKILTAGENPNSLLLRVKLLDAGTVISERTQLFVREKEAALPRCAFAARVSVQDNIASITLQSDKFARHVYVESDLAYGNFSDNFMDMFPGEPVTITVKANGATAAQLQKSLRVLTVGNIDMTHSDVYGKLQQAKAMAKPVHLFGWTTYRLGLM